MSSSSDRAVWLSPTDGPELGTVLREVGELVARGKSSTRLRLHDSFEWSLWHAGLLLATRLGRGDSLELHALDDFGEAPPLATWPGRTAPPAGRDGWPAGAFTEQILPLLKLRHLAPVADLRIAREDHDLRNLDAKTVLRLRVDSWKRRTGPAVLQCLRLLPLRGYEEEHEAAAKALRAVGMRRLEQPEVGLALAAIGVQPRVWSVRPDCPFGAETPSREVAVGMISAVLSCARECEEGICNDVDTEFLHDYRICIRRARAIVSQLKGVFPDRETARLKADLAALGRDTNLLRDLDVYLLGRERYESQVPEALRGDLGNLFEDLAARRKAEQARLRRRLRSGAYRTSVEDLTAFLEGADTWGPSAEADTPIGDLARRLLRRSYRRVRKDGKRIHADTPDDRVHELRIDTKKLRYLLEHFASLLDEKATTRVLKQLKKLQDVLGDFADYSVQGEFLLRHVEARSAAGDFSVPAAVAVGALAGVLHREQREVRDHVREHFDRFDAQENRELVEELLRPARAGGAG